jgi:lipopolysaccharide export system permease protein
LETIVGSELKSKLKANKITWQPDKKSWNMEFYQLRTFEGNKETWSNGTNKDTVLELTPKDFESKYLLHETFTLDELNKHINLLRDRESENVQAYLTEKYERYNYPFAVIILTIIGVIVSAKKSREGAGFQIAFGFVLAFVYIIFVIMSRSFAQIGGMGPLLASWLPNIVFSFIGVVMYKTVPR